MLLLSGAVRNDEPAFGYLAQMRFDVVGRDAHRLWNLRLGLAPRIVGPRVEDDNGFAAVEPALYLFHGDSLRFHADGSANGEPSHGTRCSPGALATAGVADADPDPRAGMALVFAGEKEVAGARDSDAKNRRRMTEADGHCPGFSPGRSTSSMRVPSGPAT